VRYAGATTHSPTLRPLAPPPLPSQLTSFVGRQQELADARRLLDGTRLLTLTGPGGSGKTRLAIQLATTVAADFPDGIAFVPLAPIRDPALVLPSIVQTIGLHDVREGSLVDHLAAPSPLSTWSGATARTAACAMNWV
jgi:hypothetical protein